ncbi:endonuclease/exonuclease/phosphatase family protein [Myxococcota bacterium]|nr:endonuclease/exonuclease/phosphatase family protein [Myxococcota bacterium]MBU1535866.1 endonuclease/exonuclease/phosphatase family protein [Myxococcota bacterium]
MHKRLLNLLLALALVGCGSRNDIPAQNPPPPLTTPTAITGWAVTTTSVHLTWDPVPGARAYRVRIRSNYTETETLGTVSGNSMDTEGLTPFSTYFFTVRAERGSESSPYTQEFGLHTHLDISRFPAGDPDLLDIATWNIQHFPISGFDTVSHAGELLAAMNYDLLALQEIENPQSFQSMLDLAPSYQGILSSSAAYNVNLALVYNPEHITVIEYFDLFPDDILAFPRPALVAHVQFDGGTPFWVIAVHYKCCGDGYIDEDEYDDEELRRLNASKKLANWVEMFHPDEPVLILGDFNDLITDEDSRNVFTPFYDKDEEWFFGDMAIASDDNALWSYPSWPSHLDHILMSEEFAPIFARETASIGVLPLHHYFYGDFSEYEQTISDHLPLHMVLEPF